MAITITGTLTLDESFGLQTGGVAVGDEDNNDNDVSLATLLSEADTFYNRLFTAGGLNLPTTFASNVSVAKSADDFISVDNGAVTSLGFVDGDGNPLPVYGGADPGVATDLTAVDGGAIVLFADATLGDRLVLGVDGDGDIVFAIYMNPSDDLSTAQVWMVQLEAITNGDDTDDDEPVDLLDSIGVAAGSTLEFTFDTLPSGSNLFGIVGDQDTGLVIIGKDIVLKTDGTYISNQTQEIKTSQAGVNATIGIESQMFDPGDAAYFTFVNEPDPNVTGTNLGSTEADDADNISYGSTLEGTGAFVRIAQLQGNTAPTMSIQCFNIEDDPQGRNFIAERGQNDPGETVPLITAVRVYAPDGQTLLESYSAGAEAGDSDTITISVTNGVATIAGFGSNYLIEWDTNAEFDQVLISGVAGKFDIGGFGLTEAVTTSVDIGGSLLFEDDGPTVDLELKDGALLTVDDSDFATDDSITFANLFQTNSADFGTDGEGTDGSVYELLLGDSNSGLIDTLTGLEVILSINGDGTVITGEVDDGGTDVTVFTITLDATLGTVTLDQSRAMVHDDEDDDDESISPLTLATGTVSVQRTLTDGDDDSASDSVDISEIFEFRDDGPSLPPATQDVLDLVTDDTDLTPDTDTLSTDDIFTGAPDFGNDGPNQDDPIVYALRVVGTDPDSGLVDTATGRAILLTMDGDDVVGIVDEDGSGAIDGTEAIVAIRYSLSVPDPNDLDTETVTFTQYRAVVHDDVTDPNESTLPETVNGGLVFIDQTAIDGDDDVSGVVSVDLGAVTQLLDDGPTIGPVANSLVDFAAGDSSNEDLNGDVGEDPNSSPYKITYFTPTSLAGNVLLEGVQDSDTKVTYWADTSGNGTFGDETDTAYYTMELGDQGGEGDYTFTVLVNPPPSFTEFRFDDLPSGSNLFGIVGDEGAGLVIFGKTIGLKADNTYIANLTQEIKTSQAGLHDTIGIESQMFDPGDAAYFTFVNEPDPNVTGTALGSTEADDADNIAYDSTLEGDSAFIRIAQLQGSTAPKMSIELFNIEGDPQGVEMINERGQNEAGKDPDVTAVRVYAPDGETLLESYSAGAEAGLSSSITIAIVNGVATIEGFGTDYVIEWDADEDFDQTLITGVAGKFDIGGFGFNQGNDTPDQKLDFTAQVTDGDGDFGTASWSVGIDGTGIHDDNEVSGVII